VKRIGWLVDRLVGSSQLFSKFYILLVCACSKSSSKFCEEYRDLWRSIVMEEELYSARHWILHEY